MECSVLVSKSIAIHTGEFSSLHQECKRIYPRVGREPVLCLQSKVDSWLPAHSSLKHLSRYKSHLRVGPLLSGGIREQKLSWCQSHQLEPSLWSLRGDPCCPPPVSPHLEGLR